MFGHTTIADKRLRCQLKVTNRQRARCLAHTISPTCDREDMRRNRTDAERVQVHPPRRVKERFWTLRLALMWSAKVMLPDRTIFRYGKEEERRVLRGDPFGPIVMASQDRDSASLAYQLSSATSENAHPGPVTP